MTPYYQDALDNDRLLGHFELRSPVEKMSLPQLWRIAHAAHACLEQWSQGRGSPPRLTTEEIALRDALGLQMEVFGD